MGPHIVLLPPPAPSGPPQSSSFTTTENPMRLMFTVQPPQAGMANGQIISYRVRCIPSNAFPSADDVTVTISSESEEVGDFTPAADYLCFFTASTRVGPGPETTAGLDVTTRKFSHNMCSAQIYEPIRSLDLVYYHAAIDHLAKALSSSSSDAYV